MHSLAYTKCTSSAQLLILWHVTHLPWSKNLWIKSSSLRWLILIALLFMWMKTVTFCCHLRGTGSLYENTQEWKIWLLSPPLSSLPLPSPPLSRTLKLTLSIYVITRHKLNVLIWRIEFNLLELELRGKCDQYSNLLRCFISIKPLVLLQHYQHHMYIVHRYQVCMGDV